jgi:nucleotide-binding universal stress UspA family protein
VSTEQNGGGRVLVLGYDDSRCAGAALGEALNLAAALGDRLVVVYAYRPPQPLSGGEEWREHEAALEQMGEELTQRAKAQALAVGVDVDVELIPARPVEALLQAGDRHDARMIIVGSFGESPLRGALVGSTPHKLLQLSDRPVLMVPLDEEEDLDDQESNERQESED